MDVLRKVFPHAFAVKNDVQKLVVTIIVYVVVMAVLGAITKLVGWIPLVGWLVGILCGLVGLYPLIGIVLAVLVFLKVLE